MKRHPLTLWRSSRAHPRWDDDVLSFSPDVPPVLVVKGNHVDISVLDTRYADAKMLVDEGAHTRRTPYSLGRNCVLKRIQGISQGRQDSGVKFIGPHFCGAIKQCFAAARPHAHRKNKEQIRFGRKKDVGTRPNLVFFIAFTVPADFPARRSGQVQKTLAVARAPSLSATD
jgi:hypothetical protein